MIKVSLFHFDMYIFIIASYIDPDLSGRNLIDNKTTLLKNKFFISNLNPVGTHINGKLYLIKTGERTYDLEGEVYNLP